MKESSKDKYLSQKTKAAKAKSKSGKSSNRKGPLTSFEKLVLFLLLVFIIAVPIAFFLHKDIMIYVGLINCFIIGIATAFRPGLIIDIMQKNNAKFDELYGSRIQGLSIAIRIFGIFFVVVGAFFLYQIVVQG